jgi:hypothetical protein
VAHTSKLTRYLQQQQQQQQQQSPTCKALCSYAMAVMYRSSAAPPQSNVTVFNPAQRLSTEYVHGIMPFDKRA